MDMDNAKLALALGQTNTVDALIMYLRMLVGMVNAGISHEELAGFCGAIVEDETNLAFRLLNDSGDMGKTLATEMERIMGTDEGVEMTLSAIAQSAMMNLSILG